MSDQQLPPKPDLAKLSLVDLLHTINVPQLFGAVGAVLAVGFAVGKLHSAYIERKESESLASAVALKDEKLTELTRTTEFCERKTAELGDKLKRIQATTGTSQSLPVTASCDAQVTAARLEANERNQRTESATLARLRTTEATVDELKKSASDPKRLQTYFVKSQPMSTNVPACISKATEAATRMGATPTRLTDEVHFFASTDNGIHYCFVGCYQDVVVITCNGQSRFSSRGVVGQIQTYVLGS